MRTIYENALQVQDACNLSGVVHSFSKDIIRVREELGVGCGTEEVNKHPVCILYATQIAHLVGFIGTASMEQYQHAHEACEGKVKASGDLIEQRKCVAAIRFGEWSKVVKLADNDGWQADDDCYHVGVWFEDGAEGTFNIHFVPGTADVRLVNGEWSDAAPVPTH